jgi:uncharacterized membrane protein YgcG
MLSHPTNRRGPLGPYGALLQPDVPVQHNPADWSTRDWKHVTKVEGSRFAFVCNLSWDVTEETLRAALVGCEVKEVRMGTDKETGQFTGYAHVEFVGDEDLERAMSLSGTHLVGREMKIAYATENKPKSPRGGSESPPAKRAKFAATSTASAMAPPAEEAESVCYGVQMAHMRGKFDNAAATRLGVPMDKSRGMLSRGEEVTLADGRVIKPSDCVGEVEAGLRFIVVDCPTEAHVAMLADPTTHAAIALAALANGTSAQGADAAAAAGGGGGGAAAGAGGGGAAGGGGGTGGGGAGGGGGEPEMVGDLVVVMHLAPAAVATTKRYVKWIQSCASFRNKATPGGGPPTPVRHIMVHREATGKNPIFQSAAFTASKLHAVDAGVFPEPLFSTQHDANNVVAPQLNAAKLAEDAWKEKSRKDPANSSLTPALFHPAQNLVKFNMVGGGCTS